MLPILSSASIAGQFFDGACEAKSFALFVCILEPFLVAKLLLQMPETGCDAVMHDTLCSKGYIHHMKRLLEHNETVFIVFHQQKLV